MAVVAAQPRGVPRREPTTSRCPRPSGCAPSRAGASTRPTSRRPSSAARERNRYITDRRGAAGRADLVHRDRGAGQAGQAGVDSTTNASHIHGVSVGFSDAPVTIDVFEDFQSTASLAFEQKVGADLDSIAATTTTARCAITWSRSMTRARTATATRPGRPTPRSARPTSAVSTSASTTATCSASTATGTRSCRRSAVMDAPTPR